MVLFRLIATLVFGLLAGSAFACSREGDCVVAGGFYRVFVPEGLKEGEQRPAILYFHGYRESAADILAREDIRALVVRERAVLIVPQGEGNTWSHPGSPARLRDEFAFSEAVMRDVLARIPIDPGRVLVAGFSQGAAMVWNLRCHQAERFAAFLAIAGTFWLPQPDHCAGPLRPLMQIHGLSDRTVPLSGRAIRGGAFHQGDVLRAVGMLREAGHCRAAGIRAVTEGALTCERMDDCGKGGEVAFCLHTGGHDFDPGWLGLGLRFLERSVGNAAPER
ncbi:MAG TPA: PHB depolymerase family esterase [Rhabdaerophilum sp.]|nr:PHB depolymerase family esterase [Rhabdaerophilum sp.]